MSQKIFFLVILLLLNEFAFSQAGKLDSTFGINGEVTTSLGIGFCGIGDIAIQTDGKIVSVGGADIPGPQEYAYAVARYYADGSPDTTCVIVDQFWSGANSATSVALQPDGKIVFSGNDLNDFGIARLNSDGSFDTTFNQVFDPYISVNAMALQPDEKIVVAGQAAPSNFGLVRYNNDGSLDTSFGDSGVVVTSFANDSWINSIVITPDKKIIAGGILQNLDSGFVLAQYNPSGALDSSFGIDGIVITTISQGGIASLALQSDGKIVAAGSSINLNCNWVVARYNSNGSLDGSFGNNGIASVETLDCGLPSSIAIVEDGKIIEAGYFNNGATDKDFALMRFNSNGTLDSNFGVGWKVFTDFNNSYDIAASVAIDPLKRIVVGGYADNKFALARYLSGLETGISDVDLNNSISIFPNPSTGIFQIQNTNLAIQSAEAFNLLGEKNFSTSNFNSQTSNTINLSPQPEGVYFLHLKTAEGMVVKKVVISKQ